MGKVRLDKQETFKDKYQYFFKPLIFVGLLFFTLYFCFVITPPTYGYLSYVLMSVLV